MNYIYKLTHSTVTGEDGSTHTVYGIEAYANGEADPRRTILDVFSDYEEAARFVSACNLLSLDIDHLDDVVYDVINA